MIRRLSVIAAALGLATLAGPAGAQMGPPPPHGMMPMHREMGPPSPEMEQKMAEHRAQMARDMHVVLRLRPDQESAWQAFEAAMGPPSHPDHPMGPPDGPPLTTPQRLDHMDKMMAEMEAHHARMEAATRTFYAALSPDQQQVFDALERLRGPHMGGPRLALMHRKGPGRPGR